MPRVTEVTLIISNDEIVKRDGVLAFATLVLEESLVVRDIKVMERSGVIFLGMPSKKIKDRCPNCSCKNQVTDKYCHECGTRRDRSNQPSRIHTDVAFPINQDYRSYLERKIAQAYNDRVPRERRLKYVQ
jgi:stage V sporulation protein G